MLYEVNFVLNLELIGYLLLGFGVGYMVILGITGGPTDRLERAKHDIAVRKEWFRMLAEQRKQKAGKNVTF